MSFPAAAYSRIRLRRLARRPGPASFLEYLRVQPVQFATFISLAGGGSNDRAMDIAYAHYLVWCAKNGKEPGEKTDVSTNW